MVSSGPDHGALTVAGEAIPRPAAPGAFQATKGEFDQQDPPSAPDCHEHSHSMQTQDLEAWEESGGSSSLMAGGRCPCGDLRRGR